MYGTCARNLRKVSKRHVSVRKIYANRWVNELAIGTNVHKRPKIRCFWLVANREKEDAFDSVLILFPLLRSQT